MTKLEAATKLCWEWKESEGERPQLELIARIYGVCAKELHLALVDLSIAWLKERINQKGARDEQNRTDLIGGGF